MMIYVVTPMDLDRDIRDRDADVRAAADAINKRIGDSGQSDIREAVEREIAECHPSIACKLRIDVATVEDEE